MRSTPALAEQLARNYFEVIVALRVLQDALESWPARRTCASSACPTATPIAATPIMRPHLALRQISGGFLVQSRDATDDQIVMEPATLRHPTLEEIADLTFAWRAVKHVRSNAIVLARIFATVGIGAGQPSRVNSVKIAIKQSRAGAPAARCSPPTPSSPSPTAWRPPPKQA